MHHINASVEWGIRTVVRWCGVAIGRGRCRVVSDTEWSNWPDEVRSRDEGHDEEEHVNVDLEEPAQEEEVCEHAAAEMT